MSDTEQGSSAQNDLQKLKVKLHDLHFQYTAQKGYKGAHKDLMDEIDTEYKKALEDGEDSKVTALQEQLKKGEARAKELDEGILLLEKEMSVI